MLLEDFGKPGAAGLLFALDDELQVRPLVAEKFPYLLCRCDMCDDAGFVVGGSAPVEPVSAGLGFKRGAVPQGFAHRGLYVVVGI